MRRTHVLPSGCWLPFSLIFTCCAENERFQDSGLAGVEVLAVITVEKSRFHSFDPSGGSFECNCLLRQFRPGYNQNNRSRILVYMIRTLAAAAFLSALMSAQRAEPPRVRIYFPEGHVVGASMTYGLHVSEPDYYQRHFGVNMPSGQSFFEIPAETDRFKALVWAPGCQMREFDVAVQKSDVELQFVCEPLKTVRLFRLVKGVEIGQSVTVSANYMSFSTCVWMDACKGTCRIHCGGPQITNIAIADVGSDGRFKMDLPDLSADPIVAHDWAAELEFRLNGVKQIPLLQPEGSQATTIQVAPSYPDIVLVPVKWKGLPERPTQDRSHSNAE